MVVCQCFLGGGVPLRLKNRSIHTDFTMFLGTIGIDDYIEWEVNTHDPTADGAEADADALPTYRIYEENNNTVVVSGNLAKRDDDNTLGYYYGRVQAASGDGFEVGKRY